jgi:hypothetical protein
MVVGATGSSGLCSCCVLLLGGDDASEDSSKAEDEDSGDSGCDALAVLVGRSSSVNSRNASGSCF